MQNEKDVAGREEKRVGRVKEGIKLEEGWKAHRVRET